MRDLKGAKPATAETVNGLRDFEQLEVNAELEYAGTQLNGIAPKRAHIFECDPLGHYVEPACCDERLFDVETFGPPGACILDPACGRWRIPQAAKYAGYTAIGSDIVNRLDWHETAFSVCNFLKRSPVRSVTSVVRNPPFDHIQEFCERGLEVATFKVAMIVPLRRLPAAHWLRAYRLKRYICWHRGHRCHLGRTLRPATSQAVARRISAG